MFYVAKKKPHFINLYKIPDNFKMPVNFGSIFIFLAVFFYFRPLCPRLCSFRRQSIFTPVLKAKHLILVKVCNNIDFMRNSTLAHNQMFIEKIFLKIRDALLYNGTRCSAEEYPCAAPVGWKRCTNTVKFGVLW